MKLSTALRLNASSRVAFVGAGGKTSGIFLIGKQLLETHRGLPSVLISTTTHFGLFQAQFADHHAMVASEAELFRLQNEFPKGLVLVTGAPIDGKHSQLGRFTGIPCEAMLELADIHSIPLLIEADGARMLPLKAPAEYEPVIPGFVDTVVVVAALSALGKPLSGDWVHRPERFAELTGAVLGEPITSQSLLRLLKHPLGGLKNMPPQARRIVLFNQADTIELQSVAQGMAQELLKNFHSVVIASYGQPAEKNEIGEEGKLPPETWLFQKKENEAAISVHEPVAGVVLAGGAAQRYGKPKQLLVWHGHPLVRHAAQTALDAGLSPVVVVTGAVDAPIRKALHGLPVRIVHNPIWQEGQSTSVKAGLSALPENCGACIFLLADQPRVTVALARALVELHASTLSPLVAPQVAGRRANPVLFDRMTFSELKELTGDQGGRALFSHFPATWVPWHDVGLTLDIDTPDDFQKLLDE
jgi:molybdenum cofactor cytidylyltransferase